MKMTIEEARKIINEQDEIILKAFEKRMAAAAEIGRNKIETGQPIYVAEREKEILSRIEEKAGPDLAPYGRILFETLMAVSREYQGSMRRFGLLGRKLGHSFSPEIHKMIGEETERYSYELFEREPEDLEDFILNGDWTGLNVTIPYKKDVMKYCHEISKEAERIGAVNTLVKREGRIIGYNTDYIGFRKTVEGSGAKVEGSKCAVLGSGGASATAVTVLKDLNAAEVLVVSRDGKTGCDYEMLKERAQDIDIMVNTTPVGMYPDTGVSPVDLSDYHNLKYAFDLVYNPLRTAFLCQAKLKGAAGFNGLKMLVGQAKASAEYFLGREISDDVLPKIEDSLKENKEHIVLIGMPGSGKTTIGKIVSAKKNLRFVDIDELIVEREGMTIPEIFEKYGEEGFRAMETEAVKAAMKEADEKGKTVIACGGGVITREENYSHLAQNGKILFVKRDLDQLPTEGRPLSQRMSLEKMYEERLPLYTLWADDEIDIKFISNC